MALRSSALPLIVAGALSAACGGHAPPRTHTPEQGTSTIEANGIRFAYYADGNPADPLVLLIHGFPDTAHAWDDLRPRIAAQGYYVVSPFTRGYGPSVAPDGAKFDAESLGKDALALIDAFGKEHAVIVGHDWGAVAAYSAAALDPAKVDKLAILAIPNPGTIKLRVRDLYGARHFVALKKKRAHKRVRRNDYAYVDKLYKRWSPEWSFSPNDVDDVKNSFAHPGSLQAALGYYRDLPLKTAEFLKAPTQVPVLVIAGRSDGTVPITAYDNEAGFAAGRQLEKLDAGHFPHREQPEQFLAFLLAFLKQ